MLYIVMQYLVRAIVKIVSCPKCKKAYRQNDIYIQDMYEGESVFELDCKNCGLVSMVAATVTSTQKGIQFIQESDLSSGVSDPKKCKTAVRLNKQELGQLNSMLKDYKGGFKGLFNVAKNENADKNNSGEL